MKSKSSLLVIALFCIFSLLFSCNKDSSDPESVERKKEISQKEIIEAHVINKEYNKALNLSQDITNNYWLLYNIFTNIALDGRVQYVYNESTELANSNDPFIKGLEPDKVRERFLANTVTTLIKNKKIDLAFEMLNLIKDFKLTWGKGADIAHTIMNLYDLEARQRLISTTKSITDIKVRDYALSRLTVKLSQFSHFNQSQKTAKFIDDENLQSWAYYNMLRHLLPPGRNEFELAEELIGLIKVKEWRIFAKQKFAIKTATNGWPKRSIEIAETEKEEKTQVWIKAHITMELVGYHDIESIHLVIKSIKDPQMRDHALSLVINKLIKEKSEKHAMEIVDLFNNPDLQSWAKYDIALPGIKYGGEVEELIKIFNKNENAIVD